MINIYILIVYVILIIFIITRYILTQIIAREFFVYMMVSTLMMFGVLYIVELKYDLKNYRDFTASMTQNHRKEYQEDYFSDISDWDNIKGYTCISIDNGKIWYLIDKDRKIIGDFNKLCPGLKVKIDRQHKALDEIAGYAKKNGPIGSKPLTQKEIRMLKECGAIR